MIARFCLLVGCAAMVVLAQEQPGGFKPRVDTPAATDAYQVEAGTHILMRMVNSISTKQAQPGDRIYLETAFPVTANNHIVIPRGSWVTGTITQTKRPGKVKGRGEMQVRFDSITLPNGTSRRFNADLGGLDAEGKSQLDREHNKISGDSNKGQDVKTVAIATASGAGFGSTVGAMSGQLGRGIGVGAAVGAAAGLASVLFTRGPDPMLAKGSSVEMVLDQPLTFAPVDLGEADAGPERVR